jgi:hypothetical protein
MKEILCILGDREEMDHSCITAVNWKWQKYFGKQFGNFLIGDYEDRWGDFYGWSCCPSRLWWLNMCFAHMSKLIKWHNVYMCYLLYRNNIPIKLLKTKSSVARINIQNICGIQKDQSMGKHDQIWIF